jgi:hypothetical protein
VFDRGVADALGIRVGRTGAETGTIRMLGGAWGVQFEDVDLSIAGDQESWSARVAFVTSPVLQMPFQGVLGSDGFFDRFVVTFAQYFGYFDVERAADVEPPAGHPEHGPFADPQWDRPTPY